MDWGISVILPMLFFFCLDLVIVGDIRRYENKELTRYIFLHLTIAAAVQQLCGTLVCFLDYNFLTVSIAVQYLVYLVMFTSMSFTGFAWFMYLRLLLAEKKSVSRRTQILFLFPVMIIVVCTAFSPLTHWVLWFDEGGVYHRGTLFFLQMACAYIYVLFAGIALFIYRKKGEGSIKDKVFSNFIAFAIPSMLGTFLQIRVFSGGYSAIGISFSAILMYLGLYVEEVNENKILQQTKEEQASHLQETNALNAQLNEALSSAEESTRILNRVHEVLGSAPWKIEYDEFGNEAKVEWSDGIRRLFGYENEAEFPNSLDFLLSRVHPDDYENMMREVYGVLASRDKSRVTLSSRYRAIKKDGIIRWYRVQGIVTRRENGIPLLAYGVIRDITDQEEAEIRQQETLDAFEAVHKALGSANWQMNFDESGHMTACIWSDRFRRMLGYHDTADFPNALKSWSDLLHPEDKEQVLAAFWDAVHDRSGKKTYSVQYRLRTSKEEYRWYTAAGSLTRYGNGGPKVFYGLFLDVHDQIMAKESYEAQIREITDLNNRLEENQALLKKYAAGQEAANKAKTAFLFNMSHDIRTPMNAIIGYTDLIEKYYDDKERCLDYLHKTQEANHFLLSLINNVLEMARIESGKSCLDESPTHIGAISAEIRSMFEVQMQKKNISFTTKVDVQTDSVLCDQAKMHEIYLNILSNAYKYTPAGGAIHLLVEELASERPGYARIRLNISDTGIGMSEAFLPHLFEAFSRERTATESRQEGSGLGMPIVKKLVDLMGGTIEVESKPGQGTTFRIIIDFQICDDTSENAEDSSKNVSPDFSGKRILLAEDNKLNAEIAMIILREMGFSVEQAEDGVICLDMLQKADPGYYDLILMDIQMPNLDGYKATQMIRSLPDKEKADIPIIAMTANAFEEDKKNALHAGMNGHLAKPINVKELMAVLTEMIGENGCIGSTGAQQRHLISGPQEDMYGQN